MDTGPASVQAVIKAAPVFFDGARPFLFAKKKEVLP